MAAVVTFNTTAPEPIWIGNGLIMQIGTIAMDSNYPTGGEAVTAAQFKGGAIVQLILGIDPVTGIAASYVASTGKIKCFWVDTTVDGAALAEVVDTTNLATTALIPFIALVKP